MQRLEFLYLSGNNLDYIPTPLPLSLRVLHLQVPLYTHTRTFTGSIYTCGSQMSAVPPFEGGGQYCAPPTQVDIYCFKTVIYQKKKRKKNSQITRTPKEGTRPLLWEPLVYMDRKFPEFL